MTWNEYKMQSNNRFDVKDQIESFIGKKNISIDVCFEVERLEALQSPVRYKLLLVDDKDYFCIVTEDEESILYKLDNEITAKLYDEIKKLKIKLLPEYIPMGLDGTSWSFNIDKGLYVVNIRWWMRGPDELRGLVKRVNSFVHLLWIAEVVK